ncbi:hypothetical protein MASR1M107_05850 [Ignavibacteriales bacterium]
MHDNTYHDPVNPGQISVTNQGIYHRSFAGADLIFDLVDPVAGSLIARGIGANWNDNAQQMPVMEWGERVATEIVTGAQNPGQIQITSIYFLGLNDNLGSYSNLRDDKEFIGMIRMSKQADPLTVAALKVTDVFIGMKIANNSGGFSAQQMYMRNFALIYRKRITGAQWKKYNPSSPYPANITQ